MHFEIKVISLKGRKWVKVSFSIRWMLIHVLSCVTSWVMADGYVIGWLTLQLTKPQPLQMTNAVILRLDEVCTIHFVGQQQCDHGGRSWRYKKVWSSFAMSFVIYICMIFTYRVLDHTVLEVCLGFSLKTIKKQTSTWDMSSYFFKHHPFNGSIMSKMLSEQTYMKK